MPGTSLGSYRNVLASTTRVPEVIPVSLIVSSMSCMFTKRTNCQISLRYAPYNERAAKNKTYRDNAKAKLWNEVHHTVCYALSSNANFWNAINRSKCFELQKANFRNV